MINIECINLDTLEYKTFDHYVLCARGLPHGFIELAEVNKLDLLDLLRAKSDLKPIKREAYYE